MREFSILKEPFFVDYLRKRLPQGPAELAGTVLALAKAAAMMRESRQMLADSDDATMVGIPGVYARFSWESLESARTPGDAGEPDDYVMLFSVPSELEHHEGRTHGPFVTHRYPVEIGPGRPLQRIPGSYRWRGYLGSHIAPPTPNVARIAEDLNEAFNRAAELLSTRRRLEAVAPYISRLIEAKEAANKAEIERRLAEAYQNRQAMAALMANDWLGLRILDELSSTGSLRFSELAKLSNDDKDATAAVLSRLAASGMLETDANMFICTRRGIDALQNLGFKIASDKSEATEEEV